MKQKTLAIPIRKVDYSDTSQIVSFLTPDAGLLDAIAKGAYREKNAFQGPFDLATLARIVFIRREAGDGLALVTEAEQLEGFRGIRHRWERHVAACFVIEFLRFVVTAGERAEGIFRTALTALSGIAAAESTAELTGRLGEFELAAFRALGMSSEIEACGACGRPWAKEDRSVYFSPEIAGILCPGCRARGSHRGRMVSGRLVRRLNDLAAARPERQLEPAQLRDLRNLLAEIRLFHLERPLRMLEYTSAFY